MSHGHTVTRAAKPKYDKFNNFTEGDLVILTDTAAEKWKEAGIPVPYNGLVTGARTRIVRGATLDMVEVKWAGNAKAIPMMRDVLSHQYSTAGDKGDEECES